jgi:maleate cis-trans isomerase
MTIRLKLGVLTPSSNTALEPLTSALAAAVPGCSAHFSRFKVTEIALSAQALGQFDDSKILAAAELLADARVDVIGWSGTAAGWLGISVNHDFALVEPALLEALMRETAADRPQAFATYCTNLRAAPLAAAVEAATDITLLDTVSTTMWGMLRAAGADPAVIQGWGRLFSWR